MFAEALEALSKSKWNDVMIREGLFFTSKYKADLNTFASLLAENEVNYVHKCLREKNYFQNLVRETKNLMQLLHENKELNDLTLLDLTVDETEICQLENLQVINKVMQKLRTALMKRCFNET